MGKRKPSIAVKKTRGGLEIWKTHYDEFGKVMKKQLEAVVKKQGLVKWKRINLL